jgi:hypothetical protein
MIYRVLYLAPKELVKKNDILNLQYENAISFLENHVLKALFRGEVEPKLTEFEQIFSGIKNIISSVEDQNVLGKVASLWYYFTKMAHASLGPRVGNFTEKLIAYFIKKYNKDVHRVDTNVTLSKLAKEFELEDNSRSMIDFVIVKSDEISLVELRISEHTGGKTGQGSLMDKFVKVLDWLEEKGFRKKLVSGGIKSLNLVIAILFSEDTHELLSSNNYSKGRLTSLINYILDERHIYGKINKLIQNFGYETADCEELKVQIEKRLSRERSFSLEKDGFKVKFSILFGDEFFERFTGKRLYDLIKGEEYLIADDIWLFFALTLNELKISMEFSQTFARQIYDFLSQSEKGKEITKSFIKLYQTAKRHKMDLNEYFKRLDNIITECSNEFMKYASKIGLKLRLLETNDITAHYAYLKQLCLASFALYKFYNKNKF